MGPPTIGTPHMGPPSPWDPPPRGECPRMVSPTRGWLSIMGGGSSSEDPTRRDDEGGHLQSCEPSTFMTRIVGIFLPTN
jgi:hypothetical protein